MFLNCFYPVLIPIYTYFKTVLNLFYLHFIDCEFLTSLFEFFNGYLKPLTIFLK